jgi:hypothetical protein
MAASSSNESSLTLNNLLHMTHIKLTPSNYLVWKNQISTILSFQDLLGHVDGSSPMPAATVTSDSKSSPNPEYAAWSSADQRTILFLNASLSEEAATEIIGLTSARSIWLALEAAYCNSSVERIQNLKDQLRQSTKGASSVTEYGHRFKLLCDQLSAIGSPVDESDKLHWFLRGLGTSFESFSTAVRTSRPAPAFRDLMAQAESHELFIQSLQGTSHPTIAFNAQSRPSTPSRGRGQHASRSNSSRGRGRRPPTCQLCRKSGHYASACPDLATFANPGVPTEANLAQAFHSKCHVTTSGPDWFVDSGASDHMS